MTILVQGYHFLKVTRQLDFLAPILLRLYLVPIFWMAGTKKLNGFDSTVARFANERTAGAIEKLDRAKDILQEHGHYSWLTEKW